MHVYTNTLCFWGEARVFGGEGGGEAGVLVFGKGGGEGEASPLLSHTV